MVSARNIGFSADVFRSDNDGEKDIAEVRPKKRNTGDQAGDKTQDT